MPCSTLFYALMHQLDCSMSTTKRHNRSRVACPRLYLLEVSLPLNCLKLWDDSDALLKGQAAYNVLDYSTE